MQSQQTEDELACTLMEEELRLRRQFLRRTLKPCIESVETEALGLTAAAQHSKMSAPRISPYKIAC